MVDPAERALSEGTRIEVRNRFDGRWHRGFVLVEAGPDGYRIRRSGDDQLLPGTFGADEVRREHRQGQWWY